jgi:PAS domain S-box-containing protein
MELTTDTLRVLLVEDDDVDAEATARQLRRMDSTFTVVREQCLEDACARLETSRVDLILLDLGLPDSQGLETLDRMRACAGYVPVVVFTGRQDEKLGMEAIRRGAQDYLTKDELTPRLLARVLRYAIERGKSQERLARAQRIAGLGSWEHNLRGGDIYWSEQTLRILGWDDQPISYEAFMAAVHPDDRAELRRQRERALAGEAPIDAQYRFCRPDGATCVVRQQAEVEFDEHGRPWRISGTVLDITEQVAREEQLQLLAASVAVSQDAILITDADLEQGGPHIVFVNEAFTRMTGYPAEEVLGRTPRLLQGPETDRAMLDRLKAALQRGDPFKGETINYRKDGTPYIVEWSITPVRAGETDSITHFVSVQRDVTERRVAEEHRARLAAIVESTDDAIFSKSLDGIITSWNAGAEQLYGYTADEIIGESVLTLFPTGQKEEFDQIMASVRTGNPVKQQDAVREHKDGSRLQVALTVSPIRDRKEGIVGASVVARDISAQKAMERAHRLNEARLKLALEAAEMVTWDWNLNTGTLRYSENVYELFDLSPDELGDSLEGFLGLVHPEDRDNVSRRIWTTLEEGLRDFGYEYRMRPASGERWVWSRGRVFYDGERPVRALGTSFDITARKQAEQALQDSEASYRNLFASVKEAIFIHDRAGRFIDVNPSALDMYGYEKEELIGQLPTFLAAPGKNDVSEAMEDIQRAFAGEP